MRVIMLVSLLFVVGCASSVVPENAATDTLPITLESAVEEIVSELSVENKETVKNSSFDDLILYHHGWGTGIRNSFGLWGGNTQLLTSACGSAECHPDDASMEIIYGVWNKLNGNPYRYKPGTQEP